MPLIDRDEAVEILQPHLQAIYDIIRGGWEDLQKLTEDEKRKFGPGTRAAIVHDFQVARGIQYFSALGDENAYVYELSKLYVFDIEQKIAIRFKKLDRELLSRNQPTRQVREFRGQQQLPGVEATSNIEAGYVLDELEQEIVWIGLVCPNNKGTYWEVELRESQTINTVTDMFDHSDTQETGTTFRPKKTGNVVPLKTDETKK